MRLNTMHKRQLPDEAPQFRSNAKRAKLEEPAQAKEDRITSARQLQNLLTFKQDSLGHTRSGIQSFKSFLDSVLYPQDVDEQSLQKDILREFLDSQNPKNSADQEAVFAPNIIQTWSYATQTNNDALFSAVTAVLALLLKTLSHDLAFKEHGLSLCHTILQTSQLKLVTRGLGAEKHKEHLISPCLRLLYEVVSFDGGAVAKQAYSRRDFTFDGKTLSRNLGLLGKESVTEPRKPSVRSNAVRYLLAHFKYQNEGAKIDILKQGNILRAFFENLRFDSPTLVKETFDVLKCDVLQDTNVPRNSKSYLLQDRNLGHIAALYKVEYIKRGDLKENENSVAKLAHDFLLYVCTTPELGVLTPSNGWYPPGAEAEVVPEDGHHAGIDLGLDSVEWYNRYQNRVTVKNLTLANFIQGLRPFADVKERELILAIFQAAPELVADYFFKTVAFSFEPKLTATWIGYSAFLFSTIQLPVPSNFGWRKSSQRVPPPVSIVIESILPSPLNQKVLTKALNSNSGLITFFAVRLTIIALQKLQRIIQMFKNPPINSGFLWSQASSRLLDEFSKRAPKMKNLILAFNRTPEDKYMEREAITRLLSLYYEITPGVALDEKFDVAIPLANALLRAEGIGNAENQIRLIELSHLVKVAQLSPDMRWWQKPDPLRYSPFTTLLKLASRTTSLPSNNIVQLLLAVTRDCGILQSQTETPALYALLTSLQSTHLWAPSEALFDFFDECVTRLVRRPVAYQDALDSLTIDAAAFLPEQLPKPVSLLVAPIIEQWLFLVNNQHENIQNIADWIQRLVFSLQDIGEKKEVLQNLLTQVKKTGRENCDFTKSKMLEEDVLELFKDELPFYIALSDARQDDFLEEMKINESFDKDENMIDDTKPSEEDEKHGGLSKWMHKDVEQAVDDGAIEELILCLCSRHQSIRLQAVGNIRKFIAKGETSNYVDWEQIKLLLRELIETAVPVVNNSPLSHIVGVFASRAIRILADPLHALYGKLNKFLLKGPMWNATRLPSYWIEKISLQEPEDDEGYHEELNWLLDYLFDALRTHAEMEIYRARNVFERILAIYNLSSASPAIQNKVLRLCFRAAAVEGSTTLITRSGVFAWINSQLSLSSRNRRTLERLADRLHETCDLGRIQEWSNGLAFHRKGDASVNM